MLLGYAYKITNDVSLAEDAVSEAFLRLAKSFNNVHNFEVTKIASYTVIIVRNVCYDLLKSNDSDLTYIDEISSEEPENAESYEKDLYGYMKTASKDGILTKDEFKSWCRKNNSKILKWPEKAENAEIQKLVHNNEAVRKPITKGLIFKYECSGYHFNETVREDALNLYGLKKFLEEFSDMKEKIPIDVKLWDEYLMFAQLFGIASKVMKHFKDFYPEVLQEMELSNFDFNTYYFISNLSSSGVNSAANYSSGGGGYSFGGGGGGSFGGGIGGGGFR
jgi:hypothetical protein